MRDLCGSEGAAGVVIIGIIPEPEKHPDWPTIKAFLEPAAKRGGVPILEQHEEVWEVEDGGEIIAAATARILPAEKIGEVVLVGGVDHKRWIGALDWKLGCWLRMEGMTAMRAYGRKGWQRELQGLGWRVIGEEDKIVAYEKAL